MGKIKNIINNFFFALSILFNISMVCFALHTWYKYTFIYCADIPTGQIGVLKKDVKITSFGGKDTLFTLPQGLAVEDASLIKDAPQPNPFVIYVSSDTSDLTDYTVQNTHTPNYSVKSE